MRAAFCTAPGVFTFRDLPQPQPAPGWMLVRVRSCGICGSDLDWFDGQFPAPSVCPGHEIAGEVVEIVGQSSGIAAGDRVAVEPLVACGRCAACQVGNYQICPAVRVLGVALDGGFAEYVTIPGERAYRIPTELDFAVGSLAEPAAVCVHAVRLANVSMGDSVLVLGAGTIGLLAIMAAQAAGATTVAITARHPHQAEMARRIGASHVFPASPENGQELAAFARECPFDVVLATLGGSEQILNDAIQSVRPGGTVVILGVFYAPPRCNALAVMMKEVRLVGSLTYGRRDQQADFELALKMLASNAPLARGVVTHRFGLEAIGEAFETARDKKRGSIKVAITPCE